jgi:hypothetical protein
MLDVLAWHGACFIDEEYFPNQTETQFRGGFLKMENK